MGSVKVKLVRSVKKAVVDLDSGVHVQSEKNRTIREI